MKKFVALIVAVALVGAVAAMSVPAFAGATKTVKVLDFKFNPKTLTVKKGTKVTWKWGGKVDHNVVVQQGPKKFSSKTQTTGSFSQTLTKPGTYHIVCTLHSSIGMVMTLKVTK
jgi:plastocyanin